MVMYEVIFNMDPPRRNLVEEFAFCPQRYEGGLVADDVVTDLWQLLCDCVSNLSYLLVGSNNEFVVKANQNPDARPTFDTILNRLEKMLAETRGAPEWGHTKLSDEQVKWVKRYREKSTQRRQAEGYEAYLAQVKLKKETEKREKEKKAKEEAEAELKRREAQRRSNLVNKKEQEGFGIQARQQENIEDAAEVKRKRKEAVERLKEKAATRSAREPRRRGPERLPAGGLGIRIIGAMTNESSPKEEDDGKKESPLGTRDRRTAFDLSNRQRWRLRMEDLEVGEKVLGVGKFGVVTAGRYEGASVAVKKMTLVEEIDREEFVRERLNEINALLRLQHRNVVQFIGIVLAPDTEFGMGDTYLVTEWMSGGDLGSKLKDPAYTITWKMKISILREAARAMIYIHSKSESLSNEENLSLPNHFILKHRYHPSRPPIKQHPSVLRLEGSEGVRSGSSQEHGI